MARQIFDYRLSQLVDKILYRLIDMILRSKIVFIDVMAKYWHTSQLEVAVFKEGISINSHAHIVRVQHLMYIVQTGMDINGYEKCPTL